MTMWSAFDDAEDAAEYHAEQKYTTFSPCPCGAGLSTIYCKICRTHACWGCMHERHSHPAAQCEKCNRTVLRMDETRWIGPDGSIHCTDPVSGKALGVHSVSPAVAEAINKLILQPEPASATLDAMHHSSPAKEPYR